MSNGTLLNYEIKNDPKWSFLAICRILMGIDFLQSKLLIHRDLKPNNILIDHDHIPYISDFETIRSINEKVDNEPMSKDFGSKLFASPEQLGISKYKVSLPTDIYSFGKIIEFLNKDEHLWYKKCIKYIPNERIKPKNIIEEINNEFTKIESIASTKLSVIIEYFYQNICFIRKQEEQKEKGIALYSINILQFLLNNFKKRISQQEILFQIFF